MPLYQGCLLFILLLFLILVLALGPGPRALCGFFCSSRPGPLTLGPNLARASLGPGIFGPGLNRLGLFRASPLLLVQLVKKLCGLFDPNRPGPLTLGLNSARPETSRANFGRPGLEPGRCGPYVLEPGPSRAKKSPSRIGPAREQLYLI
jgi:hypothetical protein